MIMIKIKEVNTNVNGENLKKIVQKIIEKLRKIFLQLKLESFMKKF